MPLTACTTPDLHPAAVTEPFFVPSGSFGRDAAWLPGVGPSASLLGFTEAPCPHGRGRGHTPRPPDTSELPMNGCSELLLFTLLHASLWALVQSPAGVKPSGKQPCVVSGLEGGAERLKWRLALAGLHMLQDFILFIIFKIVCRSVLVVQRREGEELWVSWRTRTGDSRLRALKHLGTSTRYYL